MPPTNNDFVQILNELNRDVSRAQPVDTLQFCANWFNHKLERDRLALRRQPGASPRGLTPSPGGPGFGAGADAGAALEDVAPDSPGGSGASGSKPSFAPTFGASPFGGGGGFAQSPALPASAPTLNVPTSDGGQVSFRNSWDSNASTDSTDTDTDHDPPAHLLNPALMDLGRRTSVSAESLPVNTTGTGPEIPKVGKTEEQMGRLRRAVRNHFLFQNLDEEQYHDVLLAMKEVEVPQNKVVIEQGQEGDYFYVVGSGTLEVYKRNDRDREQSPSGYGEKVTSYGTGDSFGELALMYAQPRAATVITTSPAILWAVDRVTFRTILLESAVRRRQLFDSFLKEVPLFEQMRDEERAKLVDSLSIATYEVGSRPVQQGEKGREFFVIIQGHAEVRQRKGSSADEVVVGHLERGDYFGELALLYNTPRAASVVVTGSSPSAIDVEVEETEQPLKPAPLKVAKLSEKQFTRLLGPLSGIMSRNAKERYGQVDTLSSGPQFHAGEPSEVGPDDLAPSGPSVTSSGTWVTGSPFG